MNLINKWILMPSFPNNRGIDIHPDDAIKRKGYTQICRCIDMEADYIVTKNLKDETFRIRGDLTKVILPDPKYIIGDDVEEISRPDIKGLINHMQWHFKREEYIYYISINNKQKKRQYFANELQRQS